MRTSAARVCIALAALACSPQSERDAGDSAGGSPTSTPVFEIELWPGEGIPVFEAVAGVLVLRERPSPDAEIAHELRVAPGTRLSFDSTRYQTIVAGPLRVRGSAEVSGRMLGATARLTRDDYYSDRFSRASLPVDSTADLQLLQHRAEGQCFVKLDEQVIEADRCPAPGDPAFVLEREPETRWWIRVVGDQGRGGWLLVADDVARVVDRTF